MRQAEGVSTLCTGLCRLLLQDLVGMQRQQQAGGTGGYGEGRNAVCRRPCWQRH